jgi:hypothetical protein
MLHHAPGGNGIDKLVDDLFQSDKLGFEAVPELISTLCAPYTLLMPRSTNFAVVLAPVQGSDVDAIAAAHRMAVWQLAQRLAADLAR